MDNATIGKFSEQKLNMLDTFIANCGYYPQEVERIREYILAADLFHKHVRQDYWDIRIAWSLIKCGVLFDGNMFIRNDDTYFWTHSIGKMLHHILIPITYIEEV